MPASFEHDYALWLTQHGSERAVAVDVLEFAHPKWGSIFVSNFGEPFAADTEPPVRSFVAQPLGFQIDATADNVTTEQTVVMKLDNANGLVAQQLRSLDEADLQTEVMVTYRAYLDTKRSAPALDPLTLFVVNLSMNRFVIEVEASADVLPNVTAGIRYTLEGFQPLAYL